MQIKSTKGIYQIGKDWKVRYTVWKDCRQVGTVNTAGARLTFSDLLGEQFGKTSQNALVR